MFSLRKSLASIASLLVLFHPNSVSADGTPNGTSPCDYYTQKTIGENTAANQQLLMALVLHSALFGAYSKYNTVPVPGLVGALTPTTYQGVYVDLNGYFNGAFASANTGKDAGEAVNFFDDGGKEVALQSKPGNGNTTSHQYTFFTHVYSYFGTFLQCSHIGSPELPAYAGKASMYEVHKYEYLNKAEMGFFIDQAVRGLKSFGFSETDAQSINMTLNGAFDQRCAPATPIIPESAGPQLQAICTAPDCALSPNDTCSAYGEGTAPAVANYTLLGNYTKAPNGSTSLNTSATTGTSSPSPTVTSGADGLLHNSAKAMGLAITIGGVAAYAFCAV